MKVIAVVQARLRSTRLPAKILLDLGGVTALERCLRRVSQFEGVDEVVVATSTDPADDVVADAVERIGYRHVRGSEQDVLARFLDAATVTEADVIVRCTSDCPLLDPAQSSRVISAYLAGQGQARPVAYASNTLDRRMPRGLDTEVVSVVALRAAFAQSSDLADREHVTRFVYRHPDRFPLLAVPPTFEGDLSHHRWTLDTLDDYRLLYAIVRRLGPAADSASLQDIVALVTREPALQSLNAHVEQKQTLSQRPGAGSSSRPDPGSRRSDETGD